MEIELKILSALEKCFSDEPLSTKKAYKKASALSGEKFYFSAAYRTEEPLRSGVPLKLEIDSPIRTRIQAFSVELVPVRLPAYAICEDKDYLRREPGLYPDLLMPIRKDTRLFVYTGMTQQLYFKVSDTYDVPAGEYPITLSLTGLDGTEYAKQTFVLKIVACRPEQKRPIFTQWFHSDCLAVYYGCEVMSERWWKIVENFMRTAAENGVNAILTPIFTPPLDTAVGGERPTVQLVSIEYSAGSYKFDFSNLDRWIDTAIRSGMRYIEFPHFFTQWGAGHAPKIIVKESGRDVRRFGWETDALDKEYIAFLRTLIPALTDYIVKRGLRYNCFFHISDEPGEKHIEAYKAAREAIADLLDGYPVVDALSDIELYKCGAVTNPIPSVDHIKPFLDEGIDGLWTYYCCGQDTKVSNRFVAMPSYRERIIGAQMFRFGIKGFLQWGYNFWFNRFSLSPVDPYMVTDGDYFVPAGDAFSVYPAPDGTAYETLHLVLFTQALEDFRALETCRSLCGTARTMAAVGNITFDEYPRDADYILSLREKINSMIEEKVTKPELDR